MICPYLKLELGPFQEMPPLLRCPNDGQYLFVMDLVVLLHWTEALGEEGNRVLCSILG